MAKPLVSVVIPVYNGEKFLSETLKSVFAQDYGFFEVVVVDDGSTDRSAEIAQSFPAKYVRQANQGHAVAKNRGVEESKGEMLAFLDADDLWHPSKLTVQQGRMEANPGWGGSIHYQRLFLEPGTEMPVQFREKRFLEDHAANIPSALMVWRPAFEKVGLFDASYVHGNDSDWFFRAKDMGVTVGVVPETLLFRRLHGNNLTRQTPALRKDLLQAVRASVLRQRGAKGGEA
ncbi:MAG: glycosyltransferase family A protein [bacterium]